MKARPVMGGIWLALGVISISGPLAVGGEPVDPRWLGYTRAEWEARLQDRSARVRVEAVKALEYFGPKALPAWTRALEDGDEVVRRLAIGQIRNPRNGPAAVPVLVQALKSADPRVRSEAAYGLGDFRPPATEAVPALIEALSDADREVRSQAMRSLGLMGPAAKAAIPALERIRRSDPEPGLRAAAAALLQDIAWGRTGR